MGKESFILTSMLKN